MTAHSRGLDQVLGGMSEEMGDVDLATRRAEDTTARLQARADILDELLAPGVPVDVTSLASEDIQIQLDAETTQAAVEEELAQIKDQLAAEASQPHAQPAHGRRAAAATSPPEQPGTTRS